MGREERVRERAHGIWEDEGRPFGRHQEHWQRACGEIDAETHLAGRLAGAGNPGGDPATAGSQSGNVSSLGLVGADDVDIGTPDRMGVDDLNVAGSLDDPYGARPSTGRSKLVGT